MKDYILFKKELQDYVNQNLLSELYQYIEENMGCFFATPYLSEYYQLLKEIEVTEADKMLPKLILGFLAFLCGDNKKLYSILNCVDESKLLADREHSLYYSLKALMGFALGHKEEYHYAKLSIEVLSKEDDSIFMANAKLTYAQILSSMQQYRGAAEMFDEAYRRFSTLDIQFSAAVALVNKLLNLYKLGELQSVMEECSQALIRSASFKDEYQEYWHVIYLPFGMCCYELNKLSLATCYLEKAKNCIDQLKLFHMHGQVELYLFKAYFIMNDRAGMESITKQTAEDFKNMHYSTAEMMVSMFRILSSEAGNQQKVQPDIERFELEYIKDSTKSRFFLIEMLAYLKILGLSSVITTSDIADYLQKLRYIGFIPYIQLFLILLAELHDIEGQNKKAAECLKEAEMIYRDYGMCVSFYMLPLKSFRLLHKINHQLYDAIKQNNRKGIAIKKSFILSVREREIIQLIAAGKSNEEIGKALFISIGTVKWHINHIFAKLEAENRIQAVQKAKMLGELSEALT